MSASSRTDFETITPQAYGALRSTFLEALRHPRATKLLSEHEDEAYFEIQQTRNNDYFPLAYHVSDVLKGHFTNLGHASEKMDIEHSVYFSHFPDTYLQHEYTFEIRDGHLIDYSHLLRAHPVVEETRYDMSLQKEHLTMADLGMEIIQYNLTDIQEMTLGDCRILLQQMRAFLE